MFVSVQFHGVLRAITKTDEIQVPLIQDGCVSDVFSYVKDCYPELPVSKDGFIVTVNNTVSAMHHRLNASDNIAFLPHIGGG